MFVVRTAGHVIDSAVLGSIEYAVTVLNVPLIAVLGHDSCGAVKATLSALDDGIVPGGYVRDIVERVMPSILLGRRDGLSRVDEFEARHVTETGTQLVARSTAIAERVSGGHAGDRRTDLSPGRRPGGFAGPCGRHRRKLTRDTPSDVGRTGMTWAYRVNCAGSRTAGPATHSDLLASPSTGDGRCCSRDRHHRCPRGRDREDHRRAPRTRALNNPAQRRRLRLRCQARTPRSRRR